MLIQQFLNREECDHLSSLLKCLIYLTLITPICCTFFITLFIKYIICHRHRVLSFCLFVFITVNSFPDLRLFTISSGFVVQKAILVMKLRFTRRHQYPPDLSRAQGSATSPMEGGIIFKTITPP